MTPNLRKQKLNTPELIVYWQEIDTKVNQRLANKNVEIVVVINAMIEKISLSRRHLSNDLQEARKAIRYQGTVIHVQRINGNGCRATRKPA